MKALAGNGIITLAMVFGIVSGASWAAGQGAPSHLAPSGAEIGQRVHPQLRTVPEQRGWLKGQLAGTVEDARQQRRFQAEINRLTPIQVGQLADVILAQQLPAGEQDARLLAELELRRAILLQRLLEREILWRRSGGVGYMPIITWLPQGTSLAASAVVSPDGRHVRINAAPFFSSIGPVYTYNLNTGETVLQPYYGGYPYPYGYSNGYSSAAPGYSYQGSTLPQGFQGYVNSPGFGQLPQQHLPPQAPSAYPPRVYHDGVRTRVGN